MNYARSDVKVKEYAARGVPWIASARGPYVDLGPDQGGLVVPGDDWVVALDRFTRVGEGAQKAPSQRRALGEVPVDPRDGRRVGGCAAAGDRARRRGSPSHVMGANRSSASRLAAAA